MSGIMSEEEYKAHVKAVWQATLILTIITISEVAGVLIYNHYFVVNGWSKIPVHIYVILASLAKAFYIVGVFMHMKYEKKALAFTVLLPTIFLIWGIIAFLWEGSSWLMMRGGI